MKVGTRLFLGFAVVLACLWVFAFLSISTYRNTYSEFILLQNDIIPGVMAMTEMYSLVNETSHTITEYIYFGGTEEREQVLAGIEELKRAGQVHFEHETHIGEKEKQAAEELTAGIQEYASLVIKLVDLKDQGASIEELTAIDHDELHTAAEALSPALLAHKAVHMEEMDGSLKAVCDGMSFGKRISVLASELAVLAAILAAFVVARSLLKPIHALRQGMAYVGEGNLDYRVGSTARDEIGDLSREFDAMTGRLAKTTTSIEDLNEEIDERKQIEEALREHEEKLRSDIELAAEIQRRMVPPLPTSFGDVIVEGVYKLSEEVGGDYYDFTCDPMGIEHLIVADVAGHGIASSLFCGAINVLFRQAAPFADAPDEFFNLLNHELIQLSGESAKFVTAVYIQINPDDGGLRILNAGHPAAYIIGSEGIKARIESSGIPLGLFSSAEWKAEEFVFDIGDVLLIYTDGVIEAKKSDGAFLGVDGLERFINDICEKEGRGKVPQNLAQKVVDTAFELCPKIEDDVTVLTVRWPEI
ncbi:SpoIIE family protein phosphatase [bacterium]|nr:SpoIIE family protein phosphatase [bacterium]